MAMFIQLEDADEHRVVIRVAGPYNPDILEDMMSRGLRAYEESLRARLAVILSAEEGDESSGE